MKSPGKNVRSEQAAPSNRRSGIVLKSARELEQMRCAGKVVHSVLQQVREMAKPGVTTAELSRAAEELITAAGGQALFKGVCHPQAKFPFPAALCTCVNEELVHGVPGDRVLKDGDILGVDCGVKLAGYCGDSATTLPIGTISAGAKHLLRVTSRALDLAIELMKPGRMWSEVATQMQRYVEGEGLSVIRDFVGHGIGRDMHEEPKVPNYWDAKQRRSDFELTPGMVLAVEPMVAIGHHAVEFGDASGWVVVMKDRKWSAHFEHTLAVTANGVEVLTDGR